MSKEINNNEKLDGILKKVKRKITSLANIKNNIINLRTLEANFNNKNFILKNSFEMEEGIKREIHTSYVIFDELKEIAARFQNLDERLLNTENERDNLLQERKVYKSKFQEYEEELFHIRTYSKIYEIELKMKCREGEKLHSDFTKLSNIQQQLKKEHTEMKTKIYNMHIELSETKSLLDDLISLQKYLSFDKDKMFENDEIDLKFKRMKRVSEIVYHFNNFPNLYNYVASKLSFDLISSIALLRCDERIIAQIERCIANFETQEGDPKHSIIDNNISDQNGANSQNPLTGKEKHTHKGKSLSPKINNKSENSPNKTSKNFTSFDISTKKSGDDINYIKQNISDLNLPIVSDLNEMSENSKINKTEGNDKFQKKTSKSKFASQENKNAKLVSSMHSKRTNNPASKVVYQQIYEKIHNINKKNINSKNNNKNRFICKIGII